MVCLYCGGPTAVTNSRSQRRSGGTWRRRQCKKCGAIFTCLETPDLARSWVVAGVNGSLHAFNRERLLVSLYDSLRHRPTALDDAAALTQTVINKLARLATSGRLERQQIVTTATKVLKNFDKAAATSYAAFHPLKG